jgi:hypothetical protein
MTTARLRLTTPKESADMADERSKFDFRYRDRVSAEEHYEVKYFAIKAGITPEQVRELIAKHGNKRETLEREAKALRGST